MQTQYSSGKVKVNYGLTINTTATEHEQLMYDLADVEYEKVSENPDIYVLAPRMSDPNRSYVRELKIVKDNIFYHISAISNMGHTVQTDEVFDKLLAEFID